jgi:hypothetical protein
MIHLSNYENWFLMYADGELTAAEQEVVLEFVKQNPSLQEEFELLSSIRFRPEENVALEDKFSLTSTYFEEVETKYSFAPDLSVQFPNKDLLYKKERTPVVSMFRYVAVAAATVVTAGIIWWMMGEAEMQQPIVQAVPRPSLPSVPTQSEPAPIKTLPVSSSVASESNNLAINLPKQNSQAQNSVIENENVIVPEMESIASVEPVALPVAVERSNSNFSLDALSAAESRIAKVMPVVATAPAINTSVLIDSELNDEKQLPVRGLLRKISRTLLHDNQEEEGQKFVQFAVFQIPVKQ